MSVWHIPFDHIVSHWTDEQFSLMCQKLNKRVQKESDTTDGKVSESELVMRSGGRIKYIGNKRG